MHLQSSSIQGQIINQTLRLEMIWVFVLGVPWIQFYGMPRAGVKSYSRSKWSLMVNGEHATTNVAIAL